MNIGGLVLNCHVPITPLTQTHLVHSTARLHITLLIDLRSSETKPGGGALWRTVIVVCRSRFLMPHFDDYVISCTARRSLKSRLNAFCPRFPVVYNPATASDRSGRVKQTNSACSPYAQFVLHPSSRFDGGDVGWKGDRDRCGM